MAPRTCPHSPALPTLIFSPLLSLPPHSSRGHHLSPTLSTSHGTTSPDPGPHLSPGPSQGLSSAHMAHHPPLRGPGLTTALACVQSGPAVAIGHPDLLQGVLGQFPRGRHPAAESGCGSLGPRSPATSGHPRSHPSGPAPFQDLIALSIFL